MELKSGAKIGPYEIVSALGAGGMGEVWKARDTRLGRIVAIKTSREKFSERFEREARAVAALNHPHICTLYDVGPDYLVMEYVDGTEIRGPMPLDRALTLAIQIASALEAAHRTLITHRDLKPANILVTKAGVKVLDFGLAKFEQTKAAAASDETVTRALTQEGSIVGTPQYMAPEQLQGKITDARADIFSFGCVLYEMLTGKRAFDGASTASVIAAILERPAPSVSEVAPAALNRVVGKCLAKDPDDRWQTARDLKDELAWIAGGGTEVTAQPQGTRYTGWLAAGTLAAVAAAASWIAWRATLPVDRSPLRVTLDLGASAATDLANDSLALSPDGTRLAWIVRRADGQPLIATRLLSQSVVTSLAGTEGAEGPFFSPDGHWIGFAAEGKLNKVSLDGGAPVPLASTSLPRGADWGADGNIVATLSVSSGLVRIPAAGGVPQTLTKLTAGETTHRWPQILPGGESVLFTAGTNGDLEIAGIDVVSLRTGQRRNVLRGGYHGRYLAPGYLVYIHQGTLFGVRFDLSRLETQGTPAPLVEDVASGAIWGGVAQFALAQSGELAGTLVYMSGQAAVTSLAWLDAAGNTLPLLSAPGSYWAPRLSPDGKGLALSGVPASATDLWVDDLSRDHLSRRTSGGINRFPVWTPDGRHIAFQSNVRDLAWMRADGGGERQLLLTGTQPLLPASFSPDGSRLTYSSASPETAFDLWTLPLDLTDPDHPKPGKPEKFIGTPANEVGSRFSPDGRWIAYQSDESGPWEVCVRPFPGPGDPWVVSSGGGTYPIWSRDGRQLFYESLDNRIMVADCAVHGDSFEAGKPRVWSTRRLEIVNRLVPNLDLAPDGKRFAVLVAPPDNDQKGPVLARFVLNFGDEVRRKLGK